MLQTLGIPPIEEEHVHLEYQISDKRDGERCEDAVEGCYTKRHRHGDCLCLKLEWGCTVELTAIGAFPGEVVLPSGEFPDHEDRADEADDDDEWPEGFANSCPEVRSVG